MNRVHQWVGCQGELHGSATPKERLDGRINTASCCGTTVDVEQHGNAMSGVTG
jgi:hypothetical protein